MCRALVSCHLVLEAFVGRPPRGSSLRVLCALRAESGGPRLANRESARGGPPPRARSWIIDRPATNQAWAITQFGPAAQMLRHFIHGLPRRTQVHRDAAGHALVVRAHESFAPDRGGGLTRRTPRPSDPAALTGNRTDQRRSSFPESASDRTGGARPAAVWRKTRAEGSAFAAGLDVCMTAFIASDRQMSDCLRYGAFERFA